MGPGRPDVAAKASRKQEYQDNTDRIEVEHTSSLSKRCYGMSCITTKLEETQLTFIALSVFRDDFFPYLAVNTLRSFASVPILA